MLFLLASFCIGTPSQIRCVEAPYVSFLWERPTPIQFKWKLNMKESIIYISRIIHVDKWYLSCHVFTLILILQYVTSVCFCLSFGICSVFACYYFLWDSAITYRKMFMYSFRAWKACTTQEHLAYSYRSAWASTGKTHRFHTGSGATRLFPQGRV